MGGQVSTAEKADLDNWFVQQVLPHEPVLTRFLLRNWRPTDEVPDILQEVYVRIYEAATHKRPYAVKPFLFAAARNLIIDRVRHMNVVSIEAVADLDSLHVEDENPSPERQTLVRDELNQLRKALAMLPPEFRQIVELRKIDNISQRSVAQQLAVSEEVVEYRVAKAMRLLTKALNGTRSQTVIDAKRYFTQAGKK